MRAWIDSLHKTARLKSVAPFKDTLHRLAAHAAAMTIEFNPRDFAQGLSYALVSSRFSAEKALHVARECLAEAVAFGVVGRDKADEMLASFSACGMSGPSIKKTIDRVLLSIAEQIGQWIRPVLGIAAESFVRD